MLAENHDLDSLDRVDQQKLFIPVKDVKNTGHHNRQKGVQDQKQASEQKSCFFNLETKPELLWEDWDLEGEFTKLLVVKNIYNKLQKMHIRPPVSTFFFGTIPQIVFLNPGTSFSLPITFRPLQRCEYEDSIEFQVKDGSFKVCLHAIVSCPKLEVPDSVKLPLCAVQHTSQIHFLLKNISRLHASFKWDYAAPFQLRPEQGLLKAGQKCCITVVFRPQEELVYQQQAFCRFGEGDKADNCCTVLLMGEAKYPYLQLQIPSSKEEKHHEQPVLHFGSVTVGQSLCKRFSIFNPCPVNVSFSLTQVPGVDTLFEPEFKCDTTSAELAPGGSRQVTVTYSPAVADTVSVVYLSLKYGGALTESQLKLTGKCIGPRVSLSSTVLDFGCGKEGQSVVQTVQLFNSSPVQAFYQWDIDCVNSVFSILPASGTVLPHSHTKLKAIYKPTNPLAHYRRVACLILHREPLFLDLVGTCHSESQQPEILKPERLLLHKPQYCSKQNSPDSTTQQYQDTHLDQQGVHFLTEKTNQNPNRAAVISTSPTEEFDQIIKGHTDSLTLNPSLFPHVTMEPSELLFNHKMISSSLFSSSFVKFVTIRSHTKRKLRLVWTVAPDSPFSVTPTSYDMAPLTSNAFQVTYDPKQLNTLHGGQLECFAYYKDSSDALMMHSPCCLTVRVIGHSFQPGKHFTPSCFLNPSQVVFPALGVISSRTVLLQNNADLPLSFCLNISDYTSVQSMHVLPGCGLIQPKNHQIITVRAVPTEDSPKQGFNLSLQLNAANFTKELTVVTVAEKPCVSLESGSSLYFHPTTVGSKTQCTHHIRNLSRLPVQFQWSIPEAEQKLISVEPDAGELHPNERSIQMWSFSPLAEKTYILKPTLNFWPVQSNGFNKLHLPLEVTGMGSRGSIETEKAVIDVGAISVGTCRLIEIPLVNNSPCHVSFHLSVQQIQTDVHPYDSEEDHSALHLDFETGTMPSHFKLLLPSTLRICTQGQHRWTISYRILNNNDLHPNPPQKLCEVRAKGVYPTLQVVDLCSSGSAGRLSKTHLWKLFSLDNLNEYMLAAPSPTELTFKTPTKHSTCFTMPSAYFFIRSCPSFFPSIMLDFIFSSAPLNSEPSEIKLMFYNPGSVRVDWAFLFPEDQQMEMKDWPVKDNQIFTVSPKSGTLLPDQKRAVQFIYSHDFIGTNQLPVVFKLSYGREIMLNLQGVTVAKEEPYLHFAPKKHVFSPVAIDDANPPLQMYELYNGGAVPVHYEVDKSVLSQLQDDNFNHPVLSCLSPEGEVSPGKTATLEWIFSPLEAKMYHMDIPIYIKEMVSSIIVKFEGRGVDSSSLSSSNVFTYSSSKDDVHYVQREPFPGQVLFPSEDSVFLGNIPVCSQMSRIFFLINVSHTDTLHYTWELPQHRNQQVVQLHPERGSLCPGECTLCVLTFIPTDYPTVYQLELICQVLQEGSFAQYCDELRCWEEEKERQKNEFIITDKKISRSQRVLIDEKPVAPPTRKGPPLLKYKPLPPIPVSNKAVSKFGVTETRAERRLQREMAKIWRRPQPPEPSLLHLSVTAHSHGSMDYFKHFPDQYHKYYRKFQSRKNNQTGPNSARMSVPAEPFTSTPGPSRDIQESILTFLLNDILEDSTFVQSLATLSSKIRTYQEIKMSPTPHPLSASSSSPEPRVLFEIVNREEAEETQTTLQPELAPADMCETLLINTLQNLMTEAVRGEFDLTAHP